MRKKSWSELTTGERVAVIVLGSIQVVLLTAALTDLHRRPGVLVRGRKIWWTLVSFINFIGPITYFVAGRRDPGDGIGRI